MSWSVLLLISSLLVVLGWLVGLLIRQDSELPAGVNGAEAAGRPAMTSCLLVAIRGWISEQQAVCGLDQDGWNLPNPLPSPPSCVSL